MRIVIQHKQVNKHTREVEAEEVALDNSYLDGYSRVRLTIGDEASVELPVSDLFTAIEAFHCHEVRYEGRQQQLCEREALIRRPSRPGDK